MGAMCVATSKLQLDRKSTRLNSSHLVISYAVFCLKEKKKKNCCIVRQGCSARAQFSSSSVRALLQPQHARPQRLSARDSDENPHLLFFFFLMRRRAPRSTLFPYTALFR